MPWQPSCKGHHCEPPSGYRWQCIVNPWDRVTDHMLRSATGIEGIAGQYYETSESRFRWWAWDGNGSGHGDYCATEEEAEAALCGAVKPRKEAKL